MDYYKNQTSYVGLSERMPNPAAPTCDWTDMGKHEHFVQFFESDDHAVGEVSEYVIHGLKAGESCIVVATSEHLKGIEQKIASDNVNLELLRSKGRYIALDACETLEKITTNGSPDREKFFEVIGKIVSDAMNSSGHAVRIFGEMVGVLCSRDAPEAAVQLEGYWNELRNHYDFSLFCGYSTSVLNSSGVTRNMSAICDGHGRVIPSESYTSIASTIDRLKYIALLQQRAMQLQAEVAELESRIAARQALELEPAVQAI